MFDPLHRTLFEPITTNQTIEVEDTETGDSLASLMFVYKATQQLHRTMIRPGKAYRVVLCA